MVKVLVSWLLLLPLPVYSFTIVFGPVYQRARSRFRKPIFISSDVQDGRSRCSDIDKVIGRIDGFACDTLSLPDIKAIAEADQRNMITMCFGLYDLLFEMCKRKDAGFADAFNVDLRESQKPSDFCLEVVTIQLSAIQHTDPVFDEWADYFNKTLLSKQSCEDLCKLQNSVHVICKLIVAGHRYLHRTLVVDAQDQDYTNQTQSQSLPTTNGTNNDTTVGTEPSSRSPDIRTTKNKDNLETTSLLPVSEVVSGMNKNSVGTEAGFIRTPEVRTTQKSTMSAVVDAPKNVASGLKDDQSTSGIYSSTEEEKKCENNSEDVSEESTTVQSVGKDKYGEGAGFAIWLAVSFVLITILTAIIIVTVRKRVSNNRPEIEQALITI